MNAKEKQIKFFKEYLKPAFKRHGYKTGAQGWWKDRGDFFNALFWMNSSYNSAQDVTFWFFVGPALKYRLRDPAKKKVLWHEVHYHQSFDIVNDRSANPFRKANRINLTDTTSYDEFLSATSTEFEAQVFPALENLKTLDDWIAFYMNSPWNSVLNHPAESLRKQIKEQGLDCGV